MLLSFWSRNLFLSLKKFLQNVGFLSQLCIGSYCSQILLRWENQVSYGRQCGKERVNVFAIYNVVKSDSAFFLEHMAYFIV